MASEQSISTNRLNRVSRFLIVGSAMWLGVGCYFLSTNRDADGCVCLVQACISFLLIACRRDRLGSPEVNIFLGSTTLALVLQSFLSGWTISYTPTFFCIVVLLAAYQLGPKAAWMWACIALTCIVAIHFAIPNSPSVGQGPLHADRVIGQVGLVFLVLVFSVLAEQSAETYAAELHLVSDELRAQTLQLNSLVGIDTLTRLPNRHQFHTEMDAALCRAESTGNSVAVLLVDLDGFKQINDHHGHAAGDMVLKDVAERLTSSVGDDVLVARLGGDEFTFIAENIPDATQAAQLAGRVVRAVSCEYQFNNRDMQLGASIGVAVYPQHGTTTDELLSNADAAMYEAKSKQLGHHMYESSLTEQLRRRRFIEEQLAEALKQDEFSLYYQPQLDLRTNTITGMEALLRWEKDGKIVTPASFIGQLEDSGSIIEVGRWVLQRACMQTREWMDQGINIRVSVNVSSLQFSQPSFLDDVWLALEQSSLPPSALDLELTETVFLDYTQDAIASIEMLREAGVSVSIDDFGTGYSSLGYLKVLPINRLKIDRSFIKDFPGDDDGMIAETIVNLAHNLGMSVLAEGVDKPEQLQFLRDVGCDEYQGYLFSEPMSAEVAFKKLQGDSKPDSQESRKSASVK